MNIRQVFLITSILLIFSCKKTEQLSVGEFTCFVNGETWRGTDPEIDRSQEGLIEFTAEDTSYRFLIHLNDNGEAIYDLTANGYIVTVIDLADEGLEEFSTHSGGGENTGTLSINSIQTADDPQTMDGTFSFKAHKISGESLTVTAGIFNNVPFLE
ncbi:MAG: hypothetical protein GQ574_02690 [Crocinitomix sp.]|nr:hypothetical protein [Crocinitomix sp.]